MVRLTSAIADWPERYGVRASCIVPGWIGLPRAIAEAQAMPVGDRPGLIAPELISEEVLRLIEDPQSGRQIVVMEGEKATEYFAAPALRLA